MEARQPCNQKLQKSTINIEKQIPRANEKKYIFRKITSTSPLKVLADISHRKVKPHRRGVHPRSNGGAGRWNERTELSASRRGALEASATSSITSLTLSLFSFSYIRSILPFIPRGCVTRAGGSRGWVRRRWLQERGGLRNPETGGSWKGGRDSRKSNC